ncbi:MAG: hypothetical protein ACE5FE_06640, partial [Acidiferrobacterales bacterium]
MGLHADEESGASTQIGVSQCEKSWYNAVPVSVAKTTTSTAPSTNRRLILTMNEVPEIPLRVTTSRKLADEWALVLVAQGLSPSVWEGTQGVVVAVPPEEVEQATNVLLAYESENPVAPPVPTEWRGSAPLYAALVFSILLLDFFFITDVWDSEVRWTEVGAADAALIVQGEWWRTVTALMLHADLKHV